MVWGPPGVGKSQIIAVDSSGSISNGELKEFTTEVDALRGQIRARVTLHACDERLDPKGPWTY